MKMKECLFILYNKKQRMNEKPQMVVVNYSSLSTFLDLANLISSKIVNG